MSWPAMRPNRPRSSLKLTRPFRYIAYSTPAELGCSFRKRSRVVTAAAFSPLRNCAQGLVEHGLLTEQGAGGAALDAFEAS